MAESILVEDHGPWVEITLNRPDRLNAFNDAMHARLRAALEGAARARAVLLTGAGRGFCAGQDLGDRDPAAGPVDLGETVRRNWAPLVRAIRGFEAPVVCAVNGVAAGAGSSVALACDIVLAAASATFIQSFARVGLIPDTGASWHLPRLLGEARAKALAMLAEPLDAATAADWGLIWRAVPDDDLMAEARALTARLAEGPTFGLAETKRAIHAAATTTLEAQLELEADAMAACGFHPDYAEGVRAFSERRAPKFSGKRP